MAIVTVNLKTLRALIKNRLEEASILLSKKKLEGAEYLCGYAVEHALKYSICKRLDWDSYPPQNPRANPAMTASFNKIENFRTHDPQTLLLLSGKHKKVYASSSLLADWNLVKEWDSEMRYGLNPKKPNEVKDMIDAARRMIKFLKKK